jgi:hypothetical protein
MKAMKFFMATSAAILFTLSACQKQDAASPVTEQSDAAPHKGKANLATGPGADHVRWDIISLNASTTPPTLNPGGVAFAAAISGSALVPELKIKLTGAGTFVAPTSGGTSGAVTGGGTWETFSGGVSTGSGTYEVTSLASWVFANFAIGIFIDNIGNLNERANGTAVLVIRYSDGSLGTLGVGCHGPGAPEGIEEGVIATKGYYTYWTGEVPGPLSEDKNRTIFHVRQQSE